MHAKLLQSCLTVCDPMDHSPPDSSVHRILQARILEWVAMSSARGPLQGVNTHLFTSPVLATGFSTTSTTQEAHMYMYPMVSRGLWNVPCQCGVISKDISVHHLK